MFFWSGFPFVRITIAFGLGITASVFLPNYSIISIFLAFVLILFVLVSSLLKQAWFIKSNWLFGLTMVLLCFVLGYMRLFFANESIEKEHLINQQSITAYRATVITYPTQKGAYFKSTVKLNLGKEEVWKPINGKVNLYVKANEMPFTYGDELLIKGEPKLLTEPLNPEEFNYKRYLSFLTIYHQQFINCADLMVLSSNNGNPLIASSLKLRNHFSSILEQHIHGVQELAIAKALLLGNKEELDNDIKNTYAASGAMHVLAVSGLHVGIIYFMVLFILRIVPVAYRKEWLIALIAIPLLWAYAFITGMSPSVLRAVTLFTILAIGKSIGRQSSMLNMLAVSAFILLLFNPFLLMQVGFQLSYIAVMGIIFIYPLIRKLWLPTTRLSIFFWDVTAISIAAQIATFPLSILYFHRFPPYFLISNLVVIPAATLIVWVGIVLFFFSWFSISIASVLGAFLAFIIKAVNAVLAFIFHLPGSDLDSIYLDVPQTWVLYCMIGFLMLFFVELKRYWAILASLSMIIFSLLISVRVVHNNGLKQVVFYNVYNHKALDFIQSGELIWIMDSSLSKQPDKIHFHIKPNRLFVGVNSTNQPLPLVYKQLEYGKAMVWNDLSILILDKQTEIDSALFDIVLPANHSGKLKLSNQFIAPSYELTTKGAFVIDL